MNWSVPLHASQEDWKPLLMSLIVLSAFEEVSLHILIDSAQRVTVGQVLLQLCKVLVSDCHVDQVCLVFLILFVGGKPVEIDFLLIP